MDFLQNFASGISPLGGANFQSGFSNLNNVADSIGSIFGFAPEDRASVLSRSEEQAKVVMTDTYNIYNTKGLEASLSFLDDWMDKEAKNLARMKSANSKASGKLKLELLTDFRQNLVTEDKQVLNSELEFQTITTTTTKKSAPDMEIQETKKDNTLIFLGLVVVLFWSQINKLFNTKTKTRW